MAKQSEITILSIYIEEHFDVKELFEIGHLQSKDATRFDYVQSATDYPRIAERLRRFFDLKSIYHYHLMWPLGPGIPEENELPKDVVTPGEWLMQDNRLVNLIANN